MVTGESKGMMKKCCVCADNDDDVDDDHDDDVVSSHTESVYIYPKISSIPDSNIISI